MENTPESKKPGYVREGLEDAFRWFRKDYQPQSNMGRNLFRLFLVVLLVVVAIFVIKWAATEYWISTHCTMVLGTRVCQQ